MSDLLDTDASLDGYGATDTEFSQSVDESSLLVDAGNDTLDDVDQDSELEAIKARVKEMEAEAEKLKAMQNDVEKQMTLSPTPSGTTAFPTFEERKEADSRSVFVGNVDYGANAEELENHFHGAGSVNRVTILCDKYTGHPKGFAYIEFADSDAVGAATALDGSMFRGRQLQVTSKRTNQFGYTSGGRGRFRGRGRGFNRYNPYARPRRYTRGRGGYRGSFHYGY